jgi:hypothetical protein
MDNELKPALAELFHTCQELWLSSQSLRAEAAILMAQNRAVRKKTPPASAKSESSLLKRRRPDS